MKMKTTILAFLFLTTCVKSAFAQSLKQDSPVFYSSTKTDLVVRKVKAAESIGGGGLFLDGDRLYHMSSDGRLIIYTVGPKGLEGVDVRFR